MSLSPSVSDEAMEKIIKEEIRMKTEDIMEILIQNLIDWINHSWEYSRKYIKYSLHTLNVKLMKWKQAYQA